MKLAEFAAWCCREMWERWEIDGGNFQDKAVECGLLQKTTYDPDVHGEDDYACPGDPYYVLSDELKTAMEKEKEKEDAGLRVQPGGATPETD